MIPDPTKSVVTIPNPRHNTEPRDQASAARANLTRNDRVHHLRVKVTGASQAHRF